MLQKEAVNHTFFPGSEWTCLNLYLGPGAADRWIMDTLPALIQDLRQTDAALAYFFVRYPDPEFHLRLRIHSHHPGMLALAVDAVSRHSKALMDINYLWKLEVDTYMREINRYGADLIDRFEILFCADAAFWTAALGRISRESAPEHLRWQAGLISMLAYLRDFSPDIRRHLEITRGVRDALAAEWQPDQAYTNRLDQKYRRLEAVLYPITRQEHVLDHLLGDLLRKRSAVFCEVFPDSLPSRAISDVIHMSLNRCFRSKHRLQEYILHYYLLKLLERHQALL